MQKYIGIGMFVIMLAVAAFFSREVDSKQEDVLVLTDANTVSLNLPIMGDTASFIQQQLLEKSDKLSHNKPIYLTLNSPGGSIDDGNKIINTAQGLPQKVHTISFFSASMSFQISQNLGTRYVVADSELMSHRAAVGGVQGNIPGNAFTRLYSLLEMVTRLDEIVAKRAGLDLEMYQKMVVDELWMGAQQSIDLHFADKQVRVQCDKSLRGYGPTQNFSFFLGTIHVKFHKCPLITEPVIEVEKSDEAATALFNMSKQELVKTFSY